MRPDRRWIVVVSLSVAAAGILIWIARASTGGDIEYVSTEESWLVFGDTPYAYLQHQQREQWTTHDGSGRVRVTYGDADFFGPAAAASWHGTFGRPPDIDSAAGPATFDTQPDVLSDAAFDDLVGARARESGRSESVEALRLARELLILPFASSQARSLATRGLQRDDAVTRQCGRATNGGPVTEYSVESGMPRIRYSLTVDDTENLVEESQTLIDPYSPVDAAPPVLIQQVLYEVRGAVPSLEAKLRPEVEERVAIQAAESC